MPSCLLDVSSVTSIDAAASGVYTVHQALQDVKDVKRCTSNLQFLKVEVFGMQALAGSGVSSSLLDHGNRRVLSPFLRFQRGSESTGPKGHEQPSDAGSSAAIALLPAWLRNSVRVATHATLFFGLSTKADAPSAHVLA